MNRYILLFLTVTVIGYYGWRKWNEAPSKAAQAVGFDFTLPTQNQTFKNKDLHKAFEKILAKEKIFVKKRNKTIDELIQYNLETGSVEMTREELRQVILRLSEDVIAFDRKSASLNASGEAGEADHAEIKLNQKREQLENFQQLETQLSGENLENN